MIPKLSQENIVLPAQHNQDELVLSDNLVAPMAAVLKFSTHWNHLKHWLKPRLLSITVNVP